MLHKDLKLNYRESLVSEKQRSTLKNEKLLFIEVGRKPSFFHLFYRNNIKTNYKSIMCSEALCISQKRFIVNFYKAQPTTFNEMTKRKMSVNY